MQLFIFKKEEIGEVPIVAQQLTNPTSTMRTQVQSLVSLSGLKGSSIAVSCGVGGRCSSDPMLLWLWCRPSAVAPIRPLAWELSCWGVALKIQNKQTKTKQNQESLFRICQSPESISQCFALPFSPEISPLQFAPKKNRDTHKCVSMCQLTAARFILVVNLTTCNRKIKSKL